MPAVFQIDHRNVTSLLEMGDVCECYSAWCLPIHSVLGICEFMVHDCMRAKHQRKRYCSRWFAKNSTPVDTVAAVHQPLSTNEKQAAALSCT